MILLQLVGDVTAAEQSTIHTLSSPAKNRQPTPIFLLKDASGSTVRLSYG
jgi:hypothetical protein